MFMFMYYLLLICFIMFFISLYLLLYNFSLFLEFELIKFLSVKLEFLLFMDWISFIFVSLVLMISFMVMMYSIEYMEMELTILRFMILVILFVLSMIFMIMSPNMLSILLGWDGLGLISYCLVIYYQNESSFNSGMVTVLTNRLGDIMILFLISMMIYNGSMNFMFLNNMNYLMFFLLMLASFTKSAQIPFSSWLPLAMAAPTPVSSLVHSSTLVTAGVYLLLRFSYLFENNKNFMNMLMLISLLTLLMSGMSANFEMDLKKIIAFSTLSQLGIMIFGLSLGLKEQSFFHLLTHAMFKSMLFMCAGVIIHNMMNNQDIRFISMILFNMPLISIIFNSANFSLCGIPFMSGFFSKDLILEMYMFNKINKLIFFILFFSMGLTVSYSLRLMLYSFLNYPMIMIFMKYNVFKSLMFYSMIYLFLMTIFLGCLLSWLLFSSKMMIFLTLKFKLLIYLFMFMGMLISLSSFNINMKNLIKNYLNMFKFMLLMWFIPMIYLVNLFKLMKFSMKLIFWNELGFNEYIIKGINLILEKILLYDLMNKIYLNILLFMFYFVLFYMSFM